MRSSSTSFFLIEKDMRVELTEPSIKHVSNEVLQRMIGFISNFSLSLNSISGCDYLSTYSEGIKRKFKEESSASLIA